MKRCDKAESDRQLFSESWQPFANKQKQRWHTTCRYCQCRKKEQTGKQIHTPVFQPASLPAMPSESWSTAPQQPSLPYKKQYQFSPAKIITASGGRSGQECPSGNGYPWRTAPFWYPLAVDGKVVRPTGFRHVPNVSIAPVSVRADWQNVFSWQPARISMPEQAGPDHFRSDRSDRVV